MTPPRSAAPLHRRDHSRPCRSSSPRRSSCRTASRRLALPPPDQTGPLALRLRAVLAQADTGRGVTRRWAAEKIALGLWGSPYRSVCESTETRSHFTLDWRADLHEDLGNPPLPPIPDDRFWGGTAQPRHRLQMVRGSVHPRSGLTSMVSVPRERFIRRSSPDEALTALDGLTGRPVQSSCRTPRRTSSSLVPWRFLGWVRRGGDLAERPALHFGPEGARWPWG